MKVRLAYGRSGLETDFPDDAVVVAPEHRDAAADQPAVLRRALREPVAGPPLRELVRPGQTVAISACDGTRPQPRQLMIPAVLDELDGIVRPRGRHRPGRHRHPPRQHATPSCAAMFGDEIVDAVRIVNHDARDDPDLQWVGTYGDGVPVWLNRSWVEADVRITTGFVEPHFFAGFSGGPKMVAPGLAGLETVLTLHDARRIGAPASARWGITEGNPVHDDVRAVAAGTGVDFALDVVLNRDQDIVGRSAGRCSPMHAAAIETARAVAMRPVEPDFDVVVTTNSGFPLDQNLYQAVKGMSRGRPGGPAGRRDRLRGRVPGRLPRPRLVPGGAVLGVVAGGAAGRDRRPAEDGAGPVAGAGPGQDPEPGAGGRPQSATSARTSSPRRISATPTTWPRRWRTRSVPPGRAHGCACCPKARRPSRTWRPDSPITACTGCLHSVSVPGADVGVSA